MSGTQWPAEGGMGLQLVPNQLKIKGKYSHSLNPKIYAVVGEIFKNICIVYIGIHDIWLLYYDNV